MQRLWLFSFVCLSIFGLQGCLKQVRKVPSKQVIQMGPMVFYARGGKVVRIEHMTPEQLFDRGGAAYRKGNYARALILYQRLTRYHKSSSYYEPALYNLGLTFEKLKRYTEAAKVYQQVFSFTKDKETKRDAAFRLGAAYLGAKDWKKAERLYRALSQIPDLKISEKLETMARLGVALAEQARFVEAADMFQRTISLYRRASRKEYLGNDYYAAMAQFRLGLLYDLRFRQRKFRATQAQMKQDLDAKATDLLTAQAHYMRTIRLRNPDWVVAALFRIGDMYRQMYDDMLHAPTPKDLTAEELRIYRRLLKKKIRILLTKANYAFERNIQAAQALGLQENQWVRKTRKQLQSLRERIIKEYYSEPTSTPTNKPTPRRQTAPTSTPTNAEPPHQPVAPNTRPHNPSQPSMRR